MPINAPYHLEALNISYQYLGSKSQMLFASTYNAIRQGLAKVSVPPGMTWDEVGQVLILIYQDASELISFDRGNTTISYNLTGQTRIPKTINLVYSCTVQKQEDYIIWLKNQAAKFRGKVPQKAGVELICDFICKTITYDHVSVKNKTSNKRQRFFDSLITHMGVCNAYAQGMSALCHFAGYRCSYMSGSKHAWNILEIDGKYTYYDVTWDDDDTNNRHTTAFAGVGYQRLFYQRSVDPDCPVFSKLPHGVELNRVSSSIPELNAILQDYKKSRPDEICLAFSPQMYEHFKRDHDAFIRIAIKNGIRYEHYLTYQKGTSITLQQCSYYPVAEFTASSLSGALASIARYRYRSFYLVSDSATIQRFTNDQYSTLVASMKTAGLAYSSCKLTYNASHGFIFIEEAQWKTPAGTTGTSANTVRSVAAPSTSGASRGAFASPTFRNTSTHAISNLQELESCLTEGKKKSSGEIVLALSPVLYRKFRDDMISLSRIAAKLGIIFTEYRASEHSSSITLQKCAYYPGAKFTLTSLPGALSVIERYKYKSFILVSDPGIIESFTINTIQCKLLKSNLTRIGLPYSSLETEINSRAGYVLIKNARWMTTNKGRPGEIADIMIFDTITDLRSIINLARAKGVRSLRLATTPDKLVELTKEEWKLFKQVEKVCRITSKSMARDYGYIELNNIQYY